MAAMDELSGFEERIDGLEATLAQASAMTAAFSSQLARLQATVQDTGADVQVLSGGISRGLRRAFEGLVFDGARLSDALGMVGRSMLDAAYAAAMKPVTNHFGSLLAEGVSNVMSGLLPIAKGATFSDGRVVPFASGGIVSGPVSFPMRGGATGLMGEAGPEAILPLARGSDGRLGVQSQGGGRAVNVVVNISTPDVEGFRRSYAQISAEMSRALQRGGRNR